MNKRAKDHQQIKLKPWEKEGESGDIIGGKSLVFATLEVCLCVLVRHMPSINPALPSARLHTPAPRHRFSDEACQLISTVLNVMVELPSLCSHTGRSTSTNEEIFMSVTL